MSIFLAAFLVFGLVLIGMAVGVIFSNRAIKGSCGGLNTMRDSVGQPMCECGAPPGSCGDESKAKGQLREESPVQV